MEDGLHDFPGGCPLPDHRSHRVQSIGAASRDFPEDHHRDPEANLHFPALLCQLDWAGRAHPGNGTEGLLLCFLCRGEKDSGWEEATHSTKLSWFACVGPWSTFLLRIEFFSADGLLSIRLPSFLTSVTSSSPCPVCLPPILPSHPLLFLLFCCFCPGLSQLSVPLPCLRTASGPLWTWGYLLDVLLAKWTLPPEKLALANERKTWGRRAVFMVAVAIVR